MKIIFNNAYHNNEKYKTMIYINGKEKKDITYNSYGQIELLCEEPATIKIHISSTILNEKYFFVWCMFYWFFAMITGGNTEQYPFGYPFDMVFVLSGLKDDNIKIKTNSVFSDKPFSCDKSNLVIENRFAMTKKIKWRWLIGEIIPYYILGLLILLLGLWIGGGSKNIFIKGLVISISIIFMIWRTIETNKIIKSKKSAINMER